MLEITGQASYHAQYDQCTRRYLQQAGVPLDFRAARETVGLRGNGHMMMLEKNSADIAKFMMKWLDKNLKPSRDIRTASN